MEQSVKKQKSNKLILLIIALILIVIGAVAIWYFSQKSELTINSDVEITLSFGNEKIDIKANKPEIIRLTEGKYLFQAIEKEFQFKDSAIVQIESRFEKKSISFIFIDKVNEELAFQNAKKENTIASFKKYLSDYPDGKYIQQSEEKVKFITSQMDENLIKADSLAFFNAKKRNKLSLLEQYKTDFPKGIYVNEANEQIKILKDLDKEAFEKAKLDNTIAAFESYIKKYKEGLYIEAAQKNIKQIKEELENKRKDDEAFNKAKADNTIESLQEYLKNYEKGLHKSEASKIIKNLEEEAYKRWVANENPTWERAVRTEKIADYKKYIDIYPRGKYISEAKNMYELLEKEQKFQLKAPPGFRYVEGGVFDMGSNKGSGDESPVHEVSLESFYMSKYEVTNKEYAEFLNKYASDVVKSGENKGQAMIYSDDWGVTFDGNEWKAQEGYEDHPVVYVTWYGANEYCKFYGLRLPTEAEWEFAAGSGIKMDKKTTFSGSNNPKAVAWYYETATTTRRVGKKGANKLGIYDMTGNVWEWVEDWHEKNYYSRSPKIDPKGPSSGSAKVLRGGSFFEITNKLRITYRDFSYPIIGYYNYGFRPVKDIK